MSASGAKMPFEALLMKKSRPPNWLPTSVKID